MSCADLSKKFTYPKDYSSLGLCSHAAEYINKEEHKKAIKGLKLAVAILSDVEMVSSFVTSNLESDECPSDIAQFTNLWYELGSGEPRKKVQKYLEELNEL